MRNIYQETTNGIRTISIMGAGKGVGVTHLALELATYYTIVRKEHVALVSTAPSDYLRQAVDVRMSLTNTHKINNMFSIYGSVTEELYSDLLSLRGKEGYTTILADCGNYFANQGDGFEHRICRYSQHKIITISLSWWKLPDSVRFFEENGSQAANWEMVAAPGPQASLKFLTREYRLPVTAMVYNADPMCLNGDSLDILARFTRQW